MKIVLVCVECGKGQPVSWPKNQDELSDFMQTLWREHRYVMSAMVAPEGDPAPGEMGTIEDGKNAVMAPLCEECALRVHGEECMRQVAKSMEPKN